MKLLFAAALLVTIPLLNAADPEEAPAAKGVAAVAESQNSKPTLDATRDKELACFQCKWYNQRCDVCKGEQSASNLNDIKIAQSGSGKNSSNVNEIGIQQSGAGSVAKSQ